ncbi:hypothetical protein RF11_10676 [Thelohanellus kitauei]|uniref:Transmembrane protein n=1 Tax=Thelohanellus kitauei TaxID=669202 RepID=A0A0C2N3W7_THEKT|nr:hypothetical protein RF11_10676 [Thelohanellus kitauei]
MDSDIFFTNFILFKIKLQKNTKYQFSNYKITFRFDKDNMREIEINLKVLTFELKNYTLECNFVHEYAQDLQPEYISPFTPCLSTPETNDENSDNKTGDQDKDFLQIEMKKRCWWTHIIMIIFITLFVVEALVMIIAITWIQQKSTKA